MKLIIGIIGFFAFCWTFSANAGLAQGVWIGKTASGQPCQMTAGVTYFENNVQHPLNERIKISIGADEFLVGHPPVVDRKQNIAFFNHDAFQGVLATPTGAKALIIDMQHTSLQEGPVGFDIIQHAWKTKQRSVIQCLGIQHSSQLRR